MANDDNEEEDYMSDTFLNVADSKPGLLTKSVALKYKKENKHKSHSSQSKQMSLKVMEKESRREGLQVAIQSDNKGYALLAKMGYKPGMAIGKRGIGRTDPVPIEVKDGRSGLGREAELKRKADAWNKARSSAMVKRQKFEEKKRGEFMERLNSQFVDRHSVADLTKSQKVCEQLDSEQEISSPAELFFWPRACLPQLDEEDEYDDDCDLSVSEQLEILTDYLREKYLYCVWCGIKFNDFEDMGQNCPGNTYTDHN